MHHVRSSTSANTGVAPTYVIGAADAIQVMSGTMTSGPDAEGREREVNGRRARRQRHRVAPSDVLGERALEALVIRVRIRIPRGGRGLAHQLDLAVRDRRTCNGDALHQSLTQRR
jgi:hypothetical protein